MSVLVTLLHYVFFVFFIVLIARFVIDWIQVFARDWRPRGIVLVIAEGVYSATDPPLRMLRRLIPPLKIGQVRLDLAFIVLFLIVSVGMNLTPASF